MQEISLIQILNKTEKIENTREFRFIEQEGIGGKPDIISGDENLKRFSLKIKLHANFCNPAKIIKEIENKAETRSCINYFQMGEYIGDFVIERFHKNIVRTVKNAIFYAEIELDLLEKPSENHEFEEQTKTTPNITTQSISGNSTKMKEFLKNAKKQIKNNVFNGIFEAVQTGDIQGLTEIGTKTLNALNSQILNEIKTTGVTNATPTVSKYLSKIQTSNALDAEQVAIIKTELKKIPDKMINNSLRLA